MQGGGNGRPGPRGWPGKAGWGAALVRRCQRRRAASPSGDATPGRVAECAYSTANENYSQYLSRPASSVGWVERSETHRPGPPTLMGFACGSTHPTTHVRPATARRASEEEARVGTGC